MQEAEIRDFRQFLQAIGLTELNVLSKKYTWSNEHVFSKIDRELVNAQWMMKLNTTIVTTVVPLFSDHLPLQLCIETQRIDTQCLKI